MEAAIRKAIDSQAAREVKELVLDNLCKQAHPSGLENFDSLEVLSMNGCGLTSLAPGLPMLPALRRLEVSDNRLTGAGLEKLPTHAPRLEVLNLSGNAIRTLDALRPLGGCLHLRVVDCYRCPVSELPDYREFMFREIRGLTVLDGRDEAGNDVDEDEEEEEEEEGDEDEEDEEDIREEDAVLKQAYGKPGDADEEEEEEDEEEEEEGEEYNGAAAPRRKRARPRSGKAELDDDEEDDEGEDSRGIGALTGDLDDEDDDDDDGGDFEFDEEDEEDEEFDDEEDEEGEYDDDDEEEDEDEEGEDEPAPRAHPSKRQRPG